MAILLKGPAAMLGLLVLGGCVWLGPRTDDGRMLAGKPCKDTATLDGTVYVEVIYGPAPTPAKPSAKPNVCKVKGGMTMLSWYGPAGQRSPFTLIFKQPLPGHDATLESRLDGDRQRINVTIGKVAAQSKHKYDIRTQWGYEDPEIIIEK